jgi:hypothetical protein
MTTPDQNPQDNSSTDPRYYAARGATSSTEQEMRVDYLRAAQLRRESLRAETVERSGQLFDQAKQIEDRWWKHDSAAVRADYDYLDDAYHDWRHSAGAMEQLYEQAIIDRVDGVTSGFSPKEWRSQRQAREMAGRGDWPQTRNPLSTEAVRTRPASAADPTSPNHYTHSASYWAEQVMRADFARVYELDQERNQTYTDSEYVQITERMHEIAEPWVTREDFRQDWHEMRVLAAETYSSRSEYADAVERIEQYLPENDSRTRMFGRNIDQVRELKGLDRLHLSADANHTPTPVASSSFAAARTTELAQNNAFSGLSTNAFATSERKGLAR